MVAPFQVVLHLHMEDCCHPFVVVVGELCCNTDVGLVAADLHLVFVYVHQVNHTQTMVVVVVAVAADCKDQDQVAVAETAAFPSHFVVATHAHDRIPRILVDVKATCLVSVVQVLHANFPWTVYRACQHSSVVLW